MLVPFGQMIHGLLLTEIVVLVIMPETVPKSVGMVGGGHRAFGILRPAGR